MSQLSISAKMSYLLAGRSNSCPSSRVWWSCHPKKS